jgi:transcription initiation factor TFIIH subunit 2
LFQLLEGFIDEFFDQNPISQMGIIITKNKRAEKVSELAGNPRKHIKVCEACCFSDKCRVIGLDSLHVHCRLSCHDSQ